MLIGVIADLHANLEATRAVLKALGKVKPDKVICLGDITGYNPNPNEVVDLIRMYQIPTVMGNHDAAVCGVEDPWFFRAAAKKVIEWQYEKLGEDNRRWLASTPEQIRFNCQSVGVHGSPSNRDDYIVDWLDAMRQMEHLNGKDLRLCFFGHTHRPALFADKGTVQYDPAVSFYHLQPDARYFINPGAVGQPRDRDSRAAFGLFDTDKMTFEFRRVEYDMETTGRKIIEAGLPEELASRLLKGK